MTNWDNNRQFIENNPIYLNGRFENLEDIPPNPPEIANKVEIFLRNKCMRMFTPEHINYLVNPHILRMQEGWSKV